MRLCSPAPLVHTGGRANTQSEEEAQGGWPVSLGAIPPPAPRNPGEAPTTCHPHTRCGEDSSGRCS